MQNSPAGTTSAAVATGSAPATSSSHAAAQPGSHATQPLFGSSYRPLASLNSSSSSASDELMSHSRGSTPSPTTPSPPTEFTANLQPLFTWPQLMPPSLHPFPPLSSAGHASAVRPPLPVQPIQPSNMSDMPPFIRSATDSSNESAALSSHSSSSSSATFSSVAASSPPAFHLLPLSPRYIDSYLSLASTDEYSLVDDATFRTLYFDHVLHTAQPQLRGASRARLLCVSAVLAVGARMYGNIAYSAQCTAVARYNARLIRSERPTTMEDTALAYRGLLVLAYHCAAMLDPGEAEWLAVADSLLAVDAARSLLSASLIHVLHQMPPTYVDALTLPANGVCEQVVRSQSLLYPTDVLRYEQCKRAVRQLISGPVDEDDELGRDSGKSEAAAALSLTGCSAETIARLHLSVCMALSAVHRRPSLRFSVYDALITVLCCEAAAWPTTQRAGVYSIKLACYLLLGSRREAVQAARATLLFHTGMGRQPSQFGADDSVMLPFALSFIRSIAVLVEWDDGHDVPCMVAAALRLFHGISALWPAAQLAETELLQRIHSRCRVEMSQASSGRLEVERSGALLVEGQQSSGSRRSSTSRLQTAMRMELALEALEMEWRQRTPLLGKESIE